MYLGVDLASVDGNKPVDWAAAKASGLSFAIFRGSYRLWADPTWKLESDRARDAGLVVGAYLFPVMDKGAPSPKVQTSAFVGSVGKLRLGDLPPTLDVEFPGGIKKTKRTRQQLLSWVSEALVELKSSFGVQPMIYTSARVWDGEDPDSLNADTLPVPPGLTNCPLWLARYPYKTRISAIGDTAAERAAVSALAFPPVPKAWGPQNVWIHQYQGDALKFPGFTSTVDLNRFFQLRKGARGDRVRWAQRKLRIVVDGAFGPATEKGVIDYQRANSLIPNGVIDPVTFAYLCRVMPQT